MEKPSVKEQGQESFRGKEWLIARGKRRKNGERRCVSMWLGVAREEAAEGSRN